MLVKANVSFSGIVSMSEGSIAEIADPVILQDLLQAGYIEPMESRMNEVATNESKRINRKRNK